METISVSKLITLFFLSLFLGFKFTHSTEITYDNKGIIINGQRKILISGSIHYPRSTPEVILSLSFILLKKFKFCDMGFFY